MSAWVHRPPACSCHQCISKLFCEHEPCKHHHGFSVVWHEDTCWLGVTEKDHKAGFLESFNFFQQCFNLHQCLFGRLGKHIEVLHELQILAGFESCSWQYCFRLALKQDYKPSCTAQARHEFKLLIKSVRSGSCWGSGSLSTMKRLRHAVSYPLEGSCAALLSIWVQNDCVWMHAVPQKCTSLGCLLCLQTSSLLFLHELESLCFLL